MRAEGGTTSQRASTTSRSGPDLDPLLRPRSIAIVGASQREARANRVIRTLQGVGYEGAIYPINPKYDDVLGLPCFPNVASTPAPADLVVVAIPASRVAGVLTEATDAGVRAAIVLASGFGEAGADGRAMQAELEGLARERGLLICGPNCFGIFNVVDKIAPFIGIVARPLVAGNVALVSQSGGLTNIVVPPLMELRGVGFSHIVSCGNQAGVTVEDYIDYLVGDPATEVIAAFVEGFKRPRSLDRIAARALAAGKPIVVLKVGRSEIAERAAAAHTGSLVGDAAVAEAALRRYGIVQVQTVGTLIETIALLSDRAVRERFVGDRPIGPARVAVLTSTGGLVGHIGDMATEVGVALPPPAAATRDRLGELLPDFAGAANPLDGTGAMYDDPALFASLLPPLANDPGVDIVAVNLDFTRFPRAVLDIPRERFVPAIVNVAPTLPRPIVVMTSRPGASTDPAISDALRAAHVPLLDGIEQSLAAFDALARYSDARGVTRSDGSAPAPREISVDLPPSEASTLLDTLAAMRLLAAAGLPVAQHALATSADEAVEVADRIGFPVALKVEGTDLAHKSDVGGVLLRLATPEAVRAGYETIRRNVRDRAPGAEILGVLVQRMAAGHELILGAKVDPSFGPVVACGLGGIHTEALRDIAVEIAPLTVGEASAMLRRLRAWPILDGARGNERADVAAVAEAIVALGQLAVELGDRLRAIDVNPVVVAGEGGGLVAVDVLIELRPGAGVLPAAAAAAGGSGA